MFKLLIISLLSLNAFAIPEGILANNMERLAYTHFSSVEYQSFKNAQGMNIFFKSFTQAENTKAIMIVPGRGEPIVKYAEVIYDLKDKGYDIHVIAHQGQGESDRHLSDSHKGYVVKFNDFVQDLDQLIKEQILPKSEGKNLYLLGHSMGGAISTHYLAQNPGVFKKAALLAPMMEINTRPLPEKAALVAATLLVKLGRGDEYAPGHGPYIAKEDIFEGNTVTGSEVRFNIGKEIFTTWPNLTLGGATAQWIKEAINATKHIDRLALNIQTPIILLQAGKDQLVKPTRQTRFCAAALNCKLIQFSNSQHEILMEQDSIRNKALKDILSFF